MKSDPWGKPRVVKGVVIASCAGLLILFAVLSYSAILGKSATYDEPLHVTAGYVHRILGDFRINPEDPALFGYWGSLPHGRQALKIDTDYKYWDQMIADFSTNQWYFVWMTLYRTEGNDGDAFLQKSRFMFVLVGMALGAVIAWWSWQLAGAWAAVIATTLFALDPNFLAHSGLVKNDVMSSLMFASLGLALWRFGRRGSIGALVAIVLTAAAAVNVKFSGVLCGPIVLIAMCIRAMLPQEWVVLGRPLRSRLVRLAAAAGVCVVVAIGSYLAIWACYGFRFAPTNDPKQLLNTQAVLERARMNRVKATFKYTDSIDPTEFQRRYDQTRPGTLPDIITWATDKRLLPQAWLHGFLYTYATTIIRSSYLIGTVKHTGWWYYFPATMLFKTPTATLVAIPLTIVGLLLVRMSRRGEASGSTEEPVVQKLDFWSVFCIALPVATYGLSAMTTNLNLGLRHILPVYPFIFIALGVGLARVMQWEPKLGKIVAGLVVLGLAAETSRAYPDYLPFFNTPSGGARGGIKLLGDSNLDWGQDLKGLANWQRQHPDRRMYFAYFGIADPTFYKVQAVQLPAQLGGWGFASSPGVPEPTERAYLAISVTNLQQIYCTVPFYTDLLTREPLAVVGGSIYIYDFPPPAPSRSNAP